MPGTPNEKILTMKHVNILTFREEFLEEEENTPVRRYRCPTVQISIGSVIMGKHDFRISLENIF